PVTSHPLFLSDHRAPPGISTLSLHDALPICTDDSHLLPDRLFHHLLGRQQIEIEVLLDDPDTARVQRHGFGPDHRRDIFELEARASGRQVERANILDEREIGVVDRERQPLVVLCKCRRAHGQHGNDRQSYCSPKGSADSRYVAPNLTDIVHSYLLRDPILLTRALVESGYPSFREQCTGVPRIGASAPGIPALRSLPFANFGPRKLTLAQLCILCIYCTY